MTDTHKEQPADVRRLDDIAGGSAVRRRKRHSAMAGDVLSPRSELGSLSTPPSTRTSLPPLLTSPPSKAKLERASSYINKRHSTFSNASAAPSVHSRSRPQSMAFPIFHSSLPYSLVRDFAYGPLHPLFYGPLPDQSSEIATPTSEVSRRLSDPPPVSSYTDCAAEGDAGEQLPQTSFADGPPYSEDEDISSPVVTSHPRHKRYKSNLVNFDQTRGRRGYPENLRRGSYAGTNGHQGHAFHSHEAHETADESSVEYLTYPPEQSSSLEVPAGASRRDSHFASTLPPRAYADADGPPYESDDDMSDSEDFIDSENRYSRTYEITIASPAEEMHGKAVALFDFERLNDNELPLVEGQIILVSYRHGQGWLVAQDPKTGESGLVPEAYVRLLRDIQGGWNGLMDGASVQHEAAHSEGLLSPISAGPEAKTPTQADHKPYAPVISTFSTTTKDLEPYPKEMLSTPAAAEGDSQQFRDDIEKRYKADAGEPMEGIEASPAPSSRPQSQHAES
jgi:hypothetical protein